MHLLAATAAPIGEGEEAIDLAQPPGEVCILSAADTELAALAAAFAGLAGGGEQLTDNSGKGLQTPSGSHGVGDSGMNVAVRVRDPDRQETAPFSLRLASLLQLRHHMSVDMWLQNTAQHAKVVIARVLGGHAYWPYGVEELQRLANERGILLALLPGGNVADEELMARSTLPPALCEGLRQLFVAGGVENARRILQVCEGLLRLPVEEVVVPPPLPFPAAGAWLDGAVMTDVAEVAGRLSISSSLPGLTRQSRAANSEHVALDARVKPGHDEKTTSRPVVPIVFYRALLEGGFTAPVAALARALERQGLAALPLFVGSLKDVAARSFLREVFAALPPAVIVNATAFAAGDDDPLKEVDVPVLQALFTGADAASWRDNPQGLGPRDLAMLVSLPELDGRIITRAASFKESAAFDKATHCRLTTYVPHQPGIAAIAGLAARYARLRALPNHEKRIALILANYPNRDSRIGNGVGLDTPASTLNILRALAAAGYGIDEATLPEDGDALIARLASGPTNARPGGEGSLEGGSGASVRLPSPPSLPGLTRQSRTANTERAALDARVRPGHDESGGMNVPVGVGDPDRQSAPDRQPNPDRQVARLTLEEYLNHFNALPQEAREPIQQRWGQPQDDPFFRDGAFVLPVRIMGPGVVCAIQPARGYNIDPKATYHDPALPPPHGYLAFYFWLRHRYRADAVIHVGKHGNLEWLPGKALALSQACFPHAVPGLMPHFYPFICNDPGEGAQAKRRTAAAVIDHLMPPLARAETHGALAELERLVDEYWQAAGLDAARREHLREEILLLAGSSGIAEDAGVADLLREDPEAALGVLDAWLCDLKEAQIRNGLHVFGELPEAAELAETLVALARWPGSTHAHAHGGPGSFDPGLKDHAEKSGKASMNVAVGVGDPDRRRVSALSLPGLTRQSRAANAERAALDARVKPGHDETIDDHDDVASGSIIAALADDLLDGFDAFDADMAAPYEGPRPALLEQVSDAPWRSNGDARERLELLACKLVREMLERTNSGSGSPDPAPKNRAGKSGKAGMNVAVGVGDPDRQDVETWLAEVRREVGPRTVAVLAWMHGWLLPVLQRSARDEIGNLLRGLEGRFVPPGASGTPSRGRLDVLPTGRNFFSLDARSLPTPAAWELGRRSADNMIQRHFMEHGEYPRAIGLSCWGTANMRTGGDDIAQAMALIGAKPVWDHTSGRITGFEILPVAALGRPRVDVTLRISGFFRDAFPQQIELFDKAIRAIGALDEPEEDNPIAARMRRRLAELRAQGLDEQQAQRMAGYRIFGARPGAYGAGLQALFDENLWETQADLAETWIGWGGHAYGAREQGEEAREALRHQLAGLDAIAHNQDNREHDILDSDDYYQFEGGFAAAAAHVQGRRVPVWHNDHSRPEKPVTRSLEEEIARVIRARATNPKWIAAMMRHGYKGAFEMAATLDYTFAFAATTGAVKGHHFEALFDAWLRNDKVREWIAAHNGEALIDMVARFEEAMARGFWRPRGNDVAALLEEMREAGRR